MMQKERAAYCRASPNDPQAPERNVQQSIQQSCGAFKTLFNEINILGLDECSTRFPSAVYISGLAAQWGRHAGGDDEIIEGTETSTVPT